jgi:hypothetical protein
MFMCMNPRYFREVMESASHAGPAKPVKEQRQGSPESLAGRIKWEAMKAIDSAGQCGPRLVEGLDKTREETRSIAEAEPASEEGPQGEVLDRFVTEEIRKDAHEQIHSYLDVTKPILKDLDTLFQEFNMDDPSKV